MLLVLGAVALAGLRPWETTSLGPDLSVSPGLGAALGDAKVVARAPSSISIGAAHVAGGGSAAVAAKPVAYTPARPESHQAIGVSQGQRLQTADKPPTASPPVETQPVAAPPPEVPAPPSAPASPEPVIASVDPGTPGPSGSPGTSGTGGLGNPGEVCEGDEYTVIVSYEIDEVTGERLPTEILIRRAESDGTVSELHVEGDLSEYPDLIAALVAEGNCVEVEFEPVEEGEDAGETPEAGTEAMEPGDTLEPVAP